MPERIKFDSIRHQIRTVEGESTTDKSVTWCQIEFRIIAANPSKKLTAIGEGRDDKEATLAAIDDINFLCQVTA